MVTGYNAGSFSAPLIKSHVASTVATPSTVSDFAWYPNSGATAFFTNDAARLAHNQPYNNTGKVVIDDGRSIPILHTDNSFLSSGNDKLVIKDLLHVP